jgi:hypothetical protein
MFGIRDPEKIHPGSRILGVKKHRIPGPDPQHWLKHDFAISKESELAS